MENKTMNYSTFEQAIKSKLAHSFHNNFGDENFDYLRFGDSIDKPSANYKYQIKTFIKKIIGYKKYSHSLKYYNRIPFKEDLCWLYFKLDPAGQKLLIELMAYRVLGYKKVKLSVNNKNYHLALKSAEKLAIKEDTLNPNCIHFLLHKMRLDSIGYNIEFYFSPLGVSIGFILQQYAYKVDKDTVIEAKPDDVVLDIGGCWGDTALYFAHKVGSKGKVYSFEFIPGNIEIHNTNTELNPHLNKQIELVKHPVTNQSGQLVYYKDAGPGSRVSMHPFTDQTGTTTTITIDDYIESNQIDKVDFIKMDIEGAEPLALQGAINTIKKYRPKLAIAIYHSMNDFVEIPRWIDDLGLGYQLFLGHYTIHAEETVIFAKVQD